MKQYQFIKKNILIKSSSELEFYNRLRQIGLHPHFNGSGQSIGVNDHGKILKWKDLGITPRDFVFLQTRELVTRISRLEQTQAIRSRVPQIEQTLKR
ncbi:MAG: hypothetical protein GC181_10750 [Bacteroidetes bacterium]|nr:hypothetical protein [Bacteroidota bacterium]